MKNLLFKLTNKDIKYAIVSPEVLYLLNASEYEVISNSGNEAILKKVNQIEKEQISKLIATRGKKEVAIYGLKDNETLILNFEAISIRKQFTDAFPEFERETYSTKTRINPMVALLAMLFTYSFIWAGTRPESTDINPEGIRWRIAYLNVKLLEWLKSLIGQELILVIGIILSITLLYFIFRPELWQYFGKEMKYSKINIKQGLQ